MNKTTKKNLKQNLEKQKYEKIWAHSKYRDFSPGLEATALFIEHFKKKIKRGDSIIDFGCGTGSASSFFFFQGFSVQMVDIAANCLNANIENLIALSFGRLQFIKACLWSLPQRLSKADWIYCCDVLEHLPEEYIDVVLSQMAKRTQKGGFLQIYLQEDLFGTLINDKLHLTVRPMNWWLKKIGIYWEIEALGPQVPNHRFSIFIKPKE